jgi:hypothetical protein
LKHRHHLLGALALALLLLLVAGETAFPPGALAVHVVWRANLRGTTVGGCEYRDLAVSPCGDAYAVGMTSSSSVSQAVVSKYDRSGRRVWLRRWVGDGAVQKFVGCVRDHTGDLVAAGLSYGLSTPGSPDRRAVVVAKFTPDGTCLWASTYTSYRPEATALAVDETGNVYVTGFCFPASPDVPEWITLKFSPQGALIWDVTWTGGLAPFGALPSGIAVGADGVYVTGQADTSAGLQGVTVGYDSSGDLLWGVPCLLEGFSTAPTSIVCADDGSLRVAGEARGSTADVAFVCRYSVQGAVEWVTGLQLPPGVSAGFSDLAIDPGGTAYACGSSGASASKSHGVVAAFDESGHLQWRRSIILSAHDELHAIDLSRYGGVAVAGNTARRFEMARLSQTGRVLWSGTAQARAGESERGVGVVAYGRRFAYVAGFGLPVSAGRPRAWAFKVRP